MPRTPRLDFPGARHHVMNRALKGATIFEDDLACAMFVDLVAELPERFDVRVHGYALMPNHYHLMLETPQANLSLAMRFLGATFAQRRHRALGTDGPVFRGRFKNQLVDDDTYWMHLLVYLHLNPVKAHLAGSPEDCIWTSHNAYVGIDRVPDWLTTHELLALFGSPGGVKQYIWEVQVGRREAPEAFDADALWRPPSTEVLAAPAPRASRTVEQALAEVCEVTGTSRDALFDRARTPRGNPIAWLAVWWIGRSTAVTRQRAAAVAGVTRPRASQQLDQLARRARKDEQVSGWMRALETRLA